MHGKSGRRILSVILAAVMAVAMTPAMAITSHAQMPAAAPMADESGIEILKDLIAEALAVDRAKYTAESLASLDTARALAQAIVGAPASYTDEQVTAAMAALDEALKNLVYKADRLTLGIAIDAAEAILAVDADNLIVPVRVELIAALDEAKQVYSNDSATETQISLAFIALTEAIWKAGFVIGDESDLLTLFNEMSSVPAAGYTEESYTAFLNALAAVEAMLAIPDHYTQSMLDEAYGALLEAYNALVPVGGQGGGPNDLDPGQGGGPGGVPGGPDLQQSGGNGADGAQTIKAQSVTLSGAPANGKFAYKASGKGNTLQLSAKVAPADATNTGVVWKSSNTRIAAVGANGLVTFKGPEGAVTITAESPDGPVVSVSLTSVKNVTAIRTPLSKLYLQKGKSLTLPVVLDDKTAPKIAVSSKLKWKSSKPSVLSVTQKGKIKANKKLKKKTTVTVTATAANGKSKKIKVVVVPKAKALGKVTAKFPKKNRMKVGATYQLKVKLRSAKATNVKVTFKSSNKKVIKVDKAGKLLALKKGKATITIKAGKKTYKKKITVK